LAKAAAGRPSSFAIKVRVEDVAADEFAFAAQKTMYAGVKIRAGDELFVFDSENEGGSGLLARAVVTCAAAVPRKAGVERQTPRVSVAARRVATVQLPLGRGALKPFDDWDDGRPETELNFKLYRQATNKIVGLSRGAGMFLAARF
jgi:hypothetical protein